MGENDIYSENSPREKFMVLCCEGDMRAREWEKGEKGAGFMGTNIPS